MEPAFDLAFALWKTSPWARTPQTIASLVLRRFRVGFLLSAAACACNSLAVRKILSGLMATQVRHPIWLPAVRPAGARTFATLYGLESFARASVASVIPIQA